jgi:hypothetical protein
LAKLGGAAGLHAKVPAVMFNLFGGGAMSEYTWYSIGSLLLVQFLGISSSTANMTVAGSAKDEFAARIGAVTGGFSKRFVTIAWAYCGLIGLALFGAWPVRPRPGVGPADEVAPAGRPRGRDDHRHPRRQAGRARRAVGRHGRPGGEEHLRAALSRGSPSDTTCSWSPA